MAGQTPEEYNESLMDNSVQGVRGFSNNTVGSRNDIKQDVTFEGTVQLRSLSSAPRSGKKGQIAMIGDELHRWDTGTDSWVSLG